MKLKTHRGLKKRVKKTKHKIKMQKSAKNHLLRNKSKRQKNLDNTGKLVHTRNLKKVKRMLPYI